MNKNSAVDCTKACVDERELALRERRCFFRVVRGLSIAVNERVTECPLHCSVSTFQIALIHNGYIRISVLHLQLTV